MTIDESQDAAWAPVDSGFPAIDRLFRQHAFDRDGWEPMFVAAMQETYDYHFAHSSEFRGHVALAPDAPSQLTTLADIEQIPWIFVQSFKEAELISVPREEIILTLTSSGTAGSKTQTFIDQTSLHRLRTAAYEGYRGLGIIRQNNVMDPPCNYLMFTYDIERAPNLGTAWTDVEIAKLTPSAERVFLIRSDTPDGELKFDLEYAIATYERFVKSGLPVRVLGFPAFIYQTFDEINKRQLAKLPVDAAANSWVLTGGGWKNHHGEIIPKRQFAQFMEATTGIRAQNVRDLFGMAEHGVGYVDCEEGWLHVPVYAHAVTRDPMTLKIQVPGIPGMLQLFSPLLKSYPSLSLLTIDEVVLHDSPCPCGRSGMRLEHTGRLGLKHYEGCAIRALAYLGTTS